MVQDASASARNSAAPPELETLTLSPAQEAIWLREQLSPGTATHIVSLALRLHGPLDVSLLRECLHTLLERHPVLRSVCVDEDGAPRLRAHDVRLALPLIDLGGVPEIHRAAAVRRLDAEDAATPFDLAAGPLVRAQLIRVAPDEHRLVLAAHHMVVDASSWGTLATELEALYAAGARGEESPLAPPQASYADYIHTQREMLASPALDSDLRYWQEKLGAIRRLELPLDRAHPRQPIRAAAQREYLLPRQPFDRLERIARARRATPFMAALAVLDVLLARYAGHGDVCVGTVLTGRVRPEWANVVGPFVNVVALRTDLRGDPTFAQALDRVRRTALEAYERQSVPFQNVVHAVNPERDPVRPPFFDVMFQLGAGDVPWPKSRGPLRIEVDRVPDPASTDFDLTFDLALVDSALAVRVVYDTDVLEGTTVDRVAGHLETLFDAVATRPDEPISRYDLLRPDERRQIVVDWNASAGAASDDLETLPRLFESSARRHPAAVAIELDGRVVTYGALARQACGLARRLRRLGVARGDVVGICLERSPELVVALLATLQAGASYLPLDPALPVGRRRRMLDASDTRLVLIDASAAEDYGRIPAARVDIAGEAPTDVAADGAAPFDARPDDVAYVIFTSGSTGSPKGVVVQHRALANVLVDMVDRIGICRDDVFLSMTTPSFDIAALELFAPLLRGATVSLVDTDTARDGTLLRERMVSSRASIVQATPTTWKLLLGAERAPRLRVALCGGESLPTRVRDALIDAAETLLGVYGPTETTIWSTSAVLDAEVDVRTIGRPIRATTLYVVDGTGSPVPVGVRGELLIGGAGVAAGYVGQGALTADRFVPNPFGPPGTRLYRTGDVVRYRGDGAVEFLGREDAQVKVRGHRVELEEVESSLARHPAVRDCAVVARRDTEGDTTDLAAYVVAAGPTPAGSTLRTFLAETLPDYMIPTSYVAVPSLATTSSGKVDRAALEAVEPDPELAAAFVEPATELERLVASVWTEALRLERVGAADDFFALGGHSLLATRVCARVRSSTGRRATVADLFAARTVRAFAQRLERDVAPGPAAAAPFVDTRPAELPLSFAQQRWWLLEQLTDGLTPYHIPVVLRYPNGLDWSLLERCLNLLVRRHDVLRARFPNDGGGQSQVIEPELRIPLRTMPVDGDGDGDGDALQRAVEAEAAARFDIERGPLVRWLLLTSGDDDVLVVTFHHLVCDAWSADVFLDELARLYETGGDAVLPALPLQYPEHALRQRHLLDSGALDPHILYWRKQLEGVVRSGFSTDRSRPPVRGHAAGRIPFTVAGPLRRRIETLARRTGVTAFMVVLAALKVLLYRHTGEADVCVGTVAAGRPETELEPLVGSFETVLPLRTHLRGDPTFVEVLVRVRDVLLQALEHQAAPFDRVAAELGIPRDPTSTPLFEMMVIVHRALDKPTRWGEPLSVQAPFARVDLTLELWDADASLTGWLEYAQDLFDEATAARIADGLLFLLDAATTQEDVSISRLPLVTEREREALRAWNSTAAPIPEVCVQQLIEARAGRTPDAIAVVCGDSAVTYRTLNERANQLAWFVRRQGTGPESVVGIALPRSIETIEAALAVLKAGGAYLPLDVSYPRRRIEYMLEDAGADALISNGDMTFDPGGASSHIHLECDREAIAAESAANPPAANDLDRLAYVFYTSGSTGAPKGVLGLHRCITNRVTYEPATFGADERCAHKTPISFIHSLWEIFAPLANGLVVVAMPNEVTADPLDLVTELAAQRVTRMLAVPSLLRMILDGDRPVRELRRLRTLMVGGEPFPTAVHEHVRAELPETRVIQFYGASEVFDAAVGDATGCAAATENVVPAGRPYTNMRVSIADTAGRPLPRGAAGDVFVAGAGLARGYHGRPSLTAERFLPDPEAVVSGGRLYWTGDRGRIRNDGALQLAGRADRQVSVRGFRVELREVEAAAEAHREVRSCAVTLNGDDDSGRQQLVAWVVPASAPPTAATLRAHLVTMVPPYMVPTMYEIVDALPTLPNGKTDFAALARRRPRVAASASTGHRAAETPTECAIAAIWEDVLGVVPASTDDDFFDLGGDSLLASRLASRLSSAFDIDVRLPLVFEASSVARQAEAVTAAVAAQIDRLTDAEVRVLLAAGGGVARDPLGRSDAP